MKSVDVGRVHIETPVALAPLAGASDEVFRRICAEQGAGLTCTEMVSAKAVIYKNKNSDALMHIPEDESPAAIQLFGSDEDALRKAVRMIRDKKHDILDFNMGCPVQKVVKNGEGSFLMTDLKKAGRLLEALVSESEKPVTVKIRAGFDDARKNAAEAAAIAEKSGVRAITVHGRTREQFYSGAADWNIIKEVKEAVNIPVFGNGDITDGPSAERMFKETGCDGIMIGRAALGNPWVFKEILHFLKFGERIPRPSREEAAAMILRHARELVLLKGEYIGIREMRSHAAWYTKGFPGAAEVRRRLNTAETYDELTALFVPGSIFLT